MNEVMKAIVLSNDTLTVQDVPQPKKAEPGHLLIKMKAAAINSGDKFFLRFPTPPGTVKSLYDIRGVSGAGAVIETGEGVPEAYANKNVAFYRQLKYSESVIGSWSEYAHVHFLDCAILPDGADPVEYSGSMVNTITPYSFLKQIITEGHRGIISTAGNSATGIALLGFCLAYDFPLIAMVRNETGRKELEMLGAKNILVQNADGFEQKLTEMSQALNATAIFDGVGGQTLTKVLPLVPRNSVIYSYGYIGDNEPVTFHASTLAVKNITIKPFANTSTVTVKDPEQLEKAVNEISSLIHMAHFKTKTGQKFSLEEINDALAYSGGNGKKAILFL
jgi:NADPH:quinone reductase-like Zn-dependent oxidoreductase